MAPELPKDSAVEGPKSYDEAEALFNASKQAVSEAEHRFEEDMANAGDDKKKRVEVYAKHEPILRELHAANDTLFDQWMEAIRNSE